MLYQTDDNMKITTELMSLKGTKKGPPSTTFGVKLKNYDPKTFTENTG